MHRTLSSRFALTDSLFWEYGEVVVKTSGVEPEWIVNLTLFNKESGLIDGL